MELNTISGLAIAGVICSVVLSMGVPIALFIAGRVKLKARISSFFIGAGTYLLFAMLLEQLLHVLVIQFCGLNAQSRPWLYYVYAALAAAVFEETGRLIAMKFWMKKWLDFPNALMYGIGHGGVEAILLGGFSGISNLVSMLMINSGAMQNTLAALPAESANQTVSQLSALWTTPAPLFFVSGIERISGWQPGKRFIPGHDKDIVLDIDPSQKGMAAAYCQTGSFDKWKDTMQPHRERDKFRFILAAAFAAPLLRIIKQRIFFVYNWGSSKGGKTAGLKAALSAWGDPERLMVNFNATQVGLERTAAFYCDLPLGIDERQLAGKNQEGLEKTIYMIASGTGKIRGAKGGGLQTMRQWRTVAMATGEEPLSTDTSQTGVSTRVLEIYSGPFETEEQASLMHQESTQNFGWAGPEFIEHVLKVSEKSICDKYDEMLRYVMSIAKGKSGSHVAGISAVALADAMIDTWFFDSQDAPEPEVDPKKEEGKDDEKQITINQESWDRAKRMAASILQEQIAATSGDVNENAVQFITDWVISNKAYFGEKAIGTCLGTMSESGNVAYIFPSTLNQALTKAGYSPRKTLKYMADNGLITVKDGGENSTKRYSIMKRFDGRVCRFIEFNIGKESQSDGDDIEAMADEAEEKYHQESMTDKDGFMSIPEGMEDELPFK